MYKMIKWDPSLDLTEFYREAGQRGFANNSSQEAMIDCFRNEREWAAWILYKDDKAVGSIAVHSFDIMGPNSYRIARACSFAQARPTTGLLTLHRYAAEHQHLIAQFLLPTCIEWAGRDKVLYGTSNKSPVGSQRGANDYYFPAMSKLGIFEWVCNTRYRDTDQSVWRIDGEAFMKSLNKYPRWS